MDSLPNKPYRNPLSGRNSAGHRFQFRVRAIARKNLYLPVSMKSLTEIRRLVNGESPLVVFNCDSIQKGRQAFYDLRKRYDFPYWAALEYSIPHLDDTRQLVTLFLNPYQHHIADTFMKRAADRRRGLYLISKSFPKCGLTTVVQAYILWLQTYSFCSNSISYTFSDYQLSLFKANLHGFLKKDRNNESHTIAFPDSDAVSYFNTYSSESILSGIDCGFVHLADMSKWIDRTGEKSSLIFSSSLSRLQRTRAELVVMEGDRPSDPKIRNAIIGDHTIPQPIRHLKLEPFGVNPFFIDKWLLASDPAITNLI
ncbi:MAG: hypothetical protein K2I92_06770, partial [Muribaculaceae bacterium]|nr:hypothetical protein [Muribaculaceae bacterium]